VDAWKICIINPILADFINILETFYLLGGKIIASGFFLEANKPCRR
jgi:hypothetical protein